MTVNQQTLDNIERLRAEGRVTEGGRASPAPPPEGCSEKVFQAAVVRLAKGLGYKAYHTYDSRRSDPGFPDLILAKPGRLLIVPELKVPPNVCTPEQVNWQRALAASGCRVFVWYPTDWNAIVAVLGGEK